MEEKYESIPIHVKVCIHEKIHIYTTQSYGF